MDFWITVFLPYLPLTRTISLHPHLPSELKKATLVDRVLNLALSRGFLSVPTPL